MLQPRAPMFSIPDGLLEEYSTNSFHHHEQHINNFHMISSGEKILTEASLGNYSVEYYKHLHDYSPKATQQAKKKDVTNFEHEGFHVDVNTMAAKKLNHNASERDRRKKMNALYSTVRSLLPEEGTHKSRRLSIPATVSRVINYIPDLQKQVQRLNQKKQNLIIKKPQNIIPAAGQEGYSTGDFGKQLIHRKKAAERCLSATQISDQEVILQISMQKAEKLCSFSEALVHMEEEGFVVLNASSFNSFEGGVFHNLHLQAQGCQVMDAERLKEKLWLLFGKVERTLPR